MYRTSASKVHPLEKVFAALGSKLSSFLNLNIIPGLLSKVHGVVDGSQYELIRGLLAFNLGEQLESTDSAAVGM